MKMEKAKEFLDFLHDDNVTDGLEYPYDEEIHGFAIGLLYGRMIKLSGVTNTLLLTTQMDYWHKIHNAILKRYKESNKHIKVDDKKMNKLIAYVTAYLPGREDLTLKTSDELKNGIILGLSMEHEL